MNPLARLIFPALRWRAATGFRHEQAAIDLTLRLGVGGYIVFGGEADAARELARGLRRSAPHPLLIASDFERGGGQQFVGLTHLPPPAALGFLGDRGLTARCGKVTALDARSVGVDWVYAPVADLDAEPENPIVQTRSFGDDPGEVAAHAAAWIAAAEGAGAVTAAKHYPGHGRTTVDSHDSLPHVTVPLEQLAATDLAPFRAAIGAGTRTIMTAHVAYPLWDPGGLPATLSPRVLGYLRAHLGFEGLIVSDALIMEGALRGGSAADASVAGVAAGVDALLYPRDPAAIAAALDRPGAVPRARLDDALARVTALAESPRGPGLGVALTDAEAAAHRAFADATADLTIHVLRGESLRIHEPLDLPIVDDDVGGPYLVGRRDLMARALGERGVRVGSGAGAARVVLVYAEPRSWKGRAALGARSLSALARLAPGAALIVLFGHPRLLEQLPGDVPVVCCWHGAPVMQEAAARWMMGRIRE